MEGSDDDSKQPSEKRFKVDSSDPDDNNQQQINPGSSNEGCDDISPSDNGPGSPAESFHSGIDESLDISDDENQYELRRTKSDEYWLAVDREREDVRREFDINYDEIGGRNADIWIENYRRGVPVSIFESKTTFRTVNEILNRQIGQSKNFSRRFYGSARSVERLRLIRLLPGEEHITASHDFNDNGQLLVTGSYWILYIWDCYTGKLLHHYTCADKDGIILVMWLSDRTLITCTSDGRIAQVEPYSGTKRTLGGHSGACNDCSIHPELPTIATTVGDDGQVLSMDTRAPVSTKLTTVKFGPRLVPLFSISSNPRNYLEFCVGGLTDSVYIFDRRRADGPLTKYSPIYLLKHPVIFVTSVKYNYDGTEILASYTNGDIYLFDRILNDGSTTDYAHRYVGHRNRKSIKNVGYFGPKSEFVVSGSDCGNIFFWEKESEAIVQCLTADSEMVQCVKSHPTIPLLASSGSDKDVKLWSPGGFGAPFRRDLEEVIKGNYERHIPQFDRSAQLRYESAAARWNTFLRSTMPSVYSDQALGSLEGENDDGNNDNGNEAGRNEDNEVPEADGNERIDEDDDDSEELAIPLPPCCHIHDDVYNDEHAYDHVHRVDNGHDDVLNNDPEDNDALNPGHEYDDVLNDCHEYDHVLRNGPEYDDFLNDQHDRHDVHNDENDRHDVHNDENDRDNVPNDENDRDDIHNDENDRDNVPNDENDRDDIHNDENDRDDIHNDEKDRDNVPNDENDRDDVHNDEKDRDDVNNDGNDCDDVNMDENDRDDIHNDEKDLVDVHNDKNDRDDIHNDEKDRVDVHNDKNDRDDLHNDEKDRVDVHNDENDRDDVNNDENDRHDVHNDEYDRDDVNNDENGRDDVNMDESGRDDIHNNENDRDDVNMDENDRDVVNMDENDRDDIHNDENDRDVVNMDENYRDHIHEDVWNNENHRDHIHEDVWNNENHRDHIHEDVWNNENYRDHTHEDVWNNENDRDYVWNGEYDHDDVWNAVYDRDDVWNDENDGDDVHDDHDNDINDRYGDENDSNTQNYCSRWKLSLSVTSPRKSTNRLKSFGLVADEDEDDDDDEDDDYYDDGGDDNNTQIYRHPWWKLLLIDSALEKLTNIRISFGPFVPGDDDDDDDDDDDNYTQSYRHPWWKLLLKASSPRFPPTLNRICYECADCKGRILS